MAGSGPRVGVLALQGDVREHLAVLRGLGADAVPVRRPAELDDVAGLVIPGGESTVVDKLSRAFGLREPLVSRITGGMPVYGTCAGLIMLSDRVTDAIAGQQTLGGLDVTVRRNAFGNQNDSFETDLDIPELGDPAVHAVFIRAPAVTETGPDVVILAALDDGRIVAVEQGNLLGTAFHPEVTGEDRFHRRFLQRVAG
ncbi:pyridoxal 5'-phosphate synthase glutaminase subunit PdxT [Pseudolysinimonas sp.]|uniref:pyridoxal 5'-phosphate synthase glutaminase subunit PdxT n=1 Tax=Pseudolysinimonas sp. TaxID=2680009 RepID=UPI003F813874